MGLFGECRPTYERVLDAVNRGECRGAAQVALICSLSKRCHGFRTRLQADRLSSLLVSSGDGVAVMKFIALLVVTSFLALAGPQPTFAESIHGVVWSGATERTTIPVDAVTPADIALAVCVRRLNDSLPPAAAVFEAYRRIAARDHVRASLTEQEMADWLNDATIVHCQRQLTHNAYGR